MIDMETKLAIVFHTSDIRWDRQNKPNDINRENRGEESDKMDLQVILLNHETFEFD